MIRSVAAIQCGSTSSIVDLSVAGIGRTRFVPRLVREADAATMSPAVRSAINQVIPRTGSGFPVALFRQASDLATGLGCILTKKGVIETEAYERTAVPGLYVAGDASRHVQLSIVAAAEGAEAAFAINTELFRDDLAEQERDWQQRGEMPPVGAAMSGLPDMSAQHG